MIDSLRRKLLSLGGRAGPLPTAPSALTYGSNPVSYVQLSAISSNSPTLGDGVATHWSVTPSLPAGLTLNPSTGVITGTPTTVTSVATYTIRAANAGGSTTCDVDITVTLAAPSGLTYSANPGSYTRGSAITANSPTISGGAVASYSVSPALPLGLSLDTTTGIITGTPTHKAFSATYVVTATNATGNTTCNLVIAVEAVYVSTVWTNTFGADTYTASGSAVNKTVGTDYAGGRTSNQIVTTGNASFEVTPADTVESFAGFAVDPMEDPNYNNKDWAIYFGNGTWFVSETGGSLNDANGARSTGDVFTTIFIGDYAKYYKNSTLIHTGTRSKSGAALRPWAGGHTVASPIITSSRIDVG